MRSVFTDFYEMQSIQAVCTGQDYRFYYFFYCALSWFFIDCVCTV